MVYRYSSPNKYQKSVLLIQYQKSIYKVQFTEISIIRDDFYLLSWPTGPAHLSESTVMKKTAQVHRQRHLSCCVDEASFQLLLVSAPEAQSSAIVVSIINSLRWWWLVKYHPFLFLLSPPLSQGGQAMSTAHHSCFWGQCIRTPSASFVSG